MPTDFRLHIDPADVLGVSRDATIQEIREAYRSKAKRYHPDTGGEEWAFRILAQSYEILSTARVAFRATGPDPGPAPFRPRPAAAASAGGGTRPTSGPSSRPFFTEPPREPNRPRHDTHETVRPGVQEAAADPTQVVDVEKVTIRYEADHVWLITERSRESRRFLSSCLNVTWPDPGSKLDPTTIPNAEGILQVLGEAFETLKAQSQPISANSSVEDGRFSGWLSYPDDDVAQSGAVKFRELLHGVGLVVKQWSRDLIIPKQWR